MAKTSQRIKPVIGSVNLRRIQADIRKLRNAIDKAEQDVFPDRTDLIKIYKEAVLDTQLYAVWELQRKAKVLALGFSIVNAAGEVDDYYTQWMRTAWFTKWCSIAFDSKLWGYEVIEFGDIVNGQISDVNRYPHHLVIPERKELRKLTSQPRGISFLEPPYSDWYMGIGNQNDFGLLLKASFQILSKRYIKASWDEFAMDFGMPTRVLKLDSSADDNAKEEAVSDLKNAGRGATLALNKDDSLEFLQAQNVDAYRVYEQNIANCNAEISKLIVGQTMTTDNGASRSQSEVHERVTDTLLVSDSQWLSDVINTQLIPFLVYHNLMPQGLSLKFDQKQELSLSGMNRVMATLLQSGQYLIPTEFIEQKFGFEVEFKPQAQVPPDNKPEGDDDSTADDEAQGGVPAGKSGKVVQASWLPTSSLVSKLYHADCGHDHHAADVHAEATSWFSDQELEQLVRDFYDGKFDAENLPPAVQSRFFRALWGGAQRGIETQWDLNKDKTFAESVKNNVAIFSAAKTWQQANELAELVVDSEGNPKAWKDYREDAKKIATDYCENYLRTEYETAYAAGQMAGLWKQTIENVGEDAMAMYDTVGDARVRPEHQKWDRIVKPLKDTFWNTHWPPNGYNCRCSIRIIENGEETVNLPEDEDIDVPPAFRFNPGKQAMIFSPEHPYFQIAEDKIDSASKAIDAAVKTSTQPSGPQTFRESDISYKTNQRLKANKYQEQRDLKASMEANGFSKDETTAILAYTFGDFGHALNNFILNQVVENKRGLQAIDMKLMAKKLYDGLYKQPEYQGVAIRMTDVDKIQGWKEGDKVRLWGFTSASMGTKVLAKQEKVVTIKITSKTARIVDRFSFYPDQKEIVFLPGIQLSILSVKESNGEYIVEAVEYTQP